VPAGQGRLRRRFAMGFAHPGQSDPPLDLAGYRAAPPLWRPSAGQAPDGWGDPQSTCGVTPEQGVAVFNEPHQPADLVDKLDRWACLLGDWDGAAGEDDEEELARVESRLAVLVNDEMVTWSRALIEAYEAWDRARGPRKTFETLATWIEAPAHLAEIAEAYGHGRRLY
jgi:hypothetical protein